MQLTKIHKPTKQSEINIVFIHGMSSSAEMWMSEKCNIPKFIKAAHNNIALYTVEYEAPKVDLNNFFTIEKYAKNLISILEARITSGSIIFICHSTGGLIVKKFTELLVSDNSYLHSSLRDILFSYCFIGVPHLGSKILTSSRLNFIPGMAHIKKTLLHRNNFLFQLKFLSPGTVELNNWFLKFLEKRNLLVENFYETRRTRIMYFIFIRVVPDASGELNVKHPNIQNHPMNRDHTTITKVSASNELIILRINFLISKIKHSQSGWFDPTIAS